MNKLRIFFYSFKQSITSTSYYQDVVKAPMFFSFKYLAFLIFATMLISTTILAVTTASYLPKLPENLQILEERLISLYPEDLVIKVTDNSLSTNQGEPFYIDIPEITETEEYEHFITFNTKGDVDDYEEFKTVLLVTDREVVYPDSQNSNVSNYRVAKIDMDNITITRQDYDTLMVQVSEYIAWIPKIAPWMLVLGVILIPLIGTAFSLIWNLIVVAFLSIITWGISGLFKNGLNYSQIFHMGLHAVTIPIVLTFLLQIFGLEFPLIFTAAFLLWMVYILAMYKGAKA